MNLKNQPPIFVPTQFQPELEKLSKAALLDIAWDYAMQCTGSCGHESTMSELRARIDIIQTHRQHARVEARS